MYFFDGENNSFDASLVIYINSTNISPIMIINRIYEKSKSSVGIACFLPGRAKDLSAPLYNHVLPFKPGFSKRPLSFTLHRPTVYISLSLRSTWLPKLFLDMRE